MILQILGLAVIVIATYHIAKTAKEYGRSSALWIFMALTVGIGFQWILPVVLGIVLALVYLAMGTPQQELQSALSTPAMIITFVCLGLSVVGLILLLKLVSRIPNEPEALPAPPEPPTFQHADVHH